MNKSLKIITGVLVLLMPVTAQDTTDTEEEAKKNRERISSERSGRDSAGKDGKEDREELKERIPVSDTAVIPVLDFKNTDIRDVLRAVGMQYNVNIYIEPEVKGAVSLYLTDIPVKDAIDFIVRRKNLEYKIENGVVKVYEPAPLPKEPEPEPEIRFSYEDSLLTADFKELPVTRVASMFIDSIGVNVIVEGGSKKKISTKLASLKVEKAVDVIFGSNGFDVIEKDGIYYVSQRNWGGDDGKTKAEGISSRRRLSITVENDSIVSIDVNNSEIDDVVRNIAAQANLDIVIYDNIKGKISARCTKNTIDDVMRFILMDTEYTFWKNKGIYFIGSREMSQQKTSSVIKLKHIRVDREDISSKLPPRITNNAVIKYDKEHNSIIIIGSIDIVTEAEEFISYLDVPIPQVLIEALVVDFNINKIRSYGMSVFTQSEGDSSGTWDSESFLPTLDLKPGVEKVENALNNVLEVFGAKKSIVDLPKNFRMAINALEASDVVKVRGTPQVATISGNPASITIGETRYYKLTKETKSAYDKEENVIGVDERFEKKQFNTKLSVTPWVMDSGYVMVKITPDFKVPRSGGSSDKPPTVDNRSLESIVRLKDGQTIVLGGQRQTQEMVNSKGVPLLSSIPVLGYLFSSKTITKNETQMMIFVTPHVYYGDEGGVSPDDYFGDEIEELLDDEKEDSKRESRGLFGRIRKNREEREKSERREMGESRDDEEK